MLNPSLTEYLPGAVLRLAVMQHIGWQGCARTHAGLQTLMGLCALCMVLVHLMSCWLQGLRPVCRWVTDSSGQLIAAAAPAAGSTLRQLPWTARGSAHVAGSHAAGYVAWWVIAHCLWQGLWKAALLC